MSIIPNKVYLIISSASGPAGSSVGRHCKTVQPVLDREPHTLWGIVWTVESVDGKPFENTQGGCGMRTMCAEDWLQDLPPDTPNAHTRSQGLDLETTHE